MIARLIKAVVMTAVVGGLVMVTQQQAMAGRWIFRPSTAGGPHIFEYQHDDSDYSHLSNTAPATPHPRNVPYDITLHNPTKFIIAYSLNDQKEPRLKPGESVKWTVMGSNENPAHFTIRFDNGQRKQITYVLNNYAAFDFHDKGAGIDLYKRKYLSLAAPARTGRCHLNRRSRRLFQISRPLDPPGK